MRLRYLTLANFKGIKEMEMKFGDGDSVIYGANGAGKTTVANAVIWLLTNKSLTGEKNFSPKTAGTHKKDHVAEAVFVDDHGKEVTLKKVFHEKWKKPRGQEAMLVGHETVLYADGMKVKDDVYQANIANLLGKGNIESLENLLITGAFTEWSSAKERRDVLFKLFYDGKAKLSDDIEAWAAPMHLTSSTEVELFRKSAKAACRDLQNELESIPAQMASLETAKITVSMKPDEAAAKEAEIHQSMEADEKALRELQGELAKARTEFEAANNTQEALEREKQLADELMAASNKQHQLTDDINSIQREIHDTQHQQEVLRKEFMAVAARVWNEHDEVCPACHRPLEPENIAELRQAFETDKADLKKEINQKGLALKDHITALSDVLAGKQEELQKMQKFIADKQEAHQAQVANRLNGCRFEDTGKCREITGWIEKLKESQRANQYTDKLSQLAEIKGLLKANERLDKQIKSLQEQKTDCAKQLERAEKDLFMADKYLNESAQLVETVVNNHFKGVKFKLFEPQLNGGLKEVCEPMIPDADGQLIDYKSANTAAQINANLEIMETLAKAYGVSVPIFVDGAERVSKLQAVECQRIALVVSAKDTALRIENSI